MRVLITHGRLSGGVAHYFRIIKNYLSVDAVFFEVGARKEKESFLKKTIHLYNDRRRFSELLSGDVPKYDLVHINPSFGYRSLVRDGLLLKVGKRLGNKTLVFFRGWDEKSVGIVEKYVFHAFFSTFNNADAFIVLASEFKEKLRKWGFKQPIYLETTLVDNQLLKDFCLKNRLDSAQFSKRIRLLFLSRIEKEKGVIEAIEVLRKLSVRYPYIRLIVAGDGPFMPKAKQFADRRGVKHKISFLGYVREEKKKEAFMNSDIFLFPTSHGEGMPNSVIEAMAFGLPVVTRPVGGLKDCFRDGRHGLITESKDPSVMASLVEKIISDTNRWKAMSRSAHDYAVERFLASNVAARLENIYDKILSLKSM